MEAKTMDSAQSEKEPCSDTAPQIKNTFTIEPESKKVLSDKFSSKWLRLELMINLVNHILIGFITIYMCWKCLIVDYVSAKHALLCTFGVCKSFILRWISLHWLCFVSLQFVILMAEGIMTHYNGNIALFPYTRKTKTTIHWILQAVGGCLGIAGGIYIMWYKKVHFTTTHGKFGLSSMIVCAISMISGLSALYSQTLRRILRPLLNKTVHNFLGIATFVLGIIAQYYGILWLWEITPEFRTMLEVITWLVLVLSCWGPLKALWDRANNIYQNF